MKKVSVVVVTWEPKNKQYLDLCIKSLKNVDYPNLEVIVVGKKSYKPIYDGVLTIAPDSDKFNGEHAQNFAIKHISDDSEYILVSNDDCVFTKNSIRELVETMGDNKMILNPVCNSDNQWCYYLALGYVKNNEFKHIQKRFFRMEEIAGDEDEFMNAESLYMKGIVVPNFLCTYATIMPRSVYEDIGEIEEGFGYCGPSDYDYCLRAKQKNIPIGIALSSLIWHFGGVTTDSVKSNDDRVENVYQFKKKWGFLPPDVTQETMNLVNQKEKYEASLTY